MCPDGGCWIWGGAKNHNGYGVVVKKKGFGHKRMYRMHRVVWEHFNGLIPPGLHACHKCDNPCCVNPAHIFLGTAKDNLSDCARKKRTHSGPLNLFCSCCGRAKEGENLRLQVYRNGWKSYRCRHCDNLKSWEYQRRKRSLVNEAQA